MDEKDQKIAELTGQVTGLETQLTEKTQAAEQALAAKTSAEAELATTSEKLATAEKANSDKDAQIAELTTKLKAAEQASSDKDAVIEKQKKDLDQASAIVRELKEQGNKVDTEKLPTVTVGRTTYEITEPAFNYKGEIITPARLSEDLDLAGVLIKEGVSFLRKVLK